MTRKQTKIIKVLLDARKESKNLDIDQLLTLLPYVCSKQALQCSLKYLERKELIHREYETRREKLRRVIVLSLVRFPISEDV